MRYDKYLLTEDITEFNEQYATITKLLRLERQEDEARYDGNSKLADKIEKQIYNTFKAINKSQKLIDAYEKEYGLEFEFDG